jgi:putative membrane protein
MKLIAAASSRCVSRIFVNPIGSVPKAHFCGEISKWGIEKSSTYRTQKYRLWFFATEPVEALVRQSAEDVMPRAKDGGAMRRIVGALSAVIVPAVAWAQERPYDFWGMHPMWGMWGAWGIGMMFMMLVFWGLIIAGLVLGLRWLVTQGRESRSDTALDILRQRYARGEIDKEEFEARKRDLS